MRPTERPTPTQENHFQLRALIKSTNGATVWPLGQLNEEDEEAQEEEFSSSYLWSLRDALRANERNTNQPASQPAAEPA